MEEKTPLLKIIITMVFVAVFFSASLYYGVMYAAPYDWQVEGKTIIFLGNLENRYNTSLEDAQSLAGALIASRIYGDAEINATAIETGGLHYTELIVSNAEHSCRILVNPASKEVEAKLLS